MYEGEQVLAFKEDLFKPEEYPKGFTKDVDKYLNKIFSPNNLLFVDRAQAEEDPSYKQLIPYCVFTNKPGIFVYQRTKKGGESRLHDRYSIGVGGHINPCDNSDDSFRTSYLAGMIRELNEEVGLDNDFATSKVDGVIYDDSNKVGQVHFGIVHHLVLFSDDKMKCKDEALANGEFWPLYRLFDNIDKFENWSQLVIKGLWQ